MTPHSPRVRVGMLTPSSNTCLEPVTYRLLADLPQVTAHFSRIPVTRIGLDDSAAAQFDVVGMAAAAQLLADAKVDVVVWNGTSGSWLGLDRDRAIVKQLEKVTGAPATTSTLAMLDACAVYGVTCLGLATPYTEDVNSGIAQTYAAHGVEVVNESHLGITDNESFARVTEDEVARQLREVGTDVHAAAVVCTNVHGAGVVPALERELGLTVLDSVAVTLWKALDMAGGAIITGHGSVLRDGTLRGRLQRVCQELLDSTGADRTTVRLDLPDHDLGVDLAAAESLRPGMRSIRREAGLDQRRLNTVVWLEENRHNLVQPHFRGVPMPPQALIDVYDVHAQMLGPVEGADGDLVGWLAAHSTRERAWSGADVVAMDKARAEVASILGIH